MSNDWLTSLRSFSQSRQEQSPGFLEPRVLFFVETGTVDLFFSNPSETSRLFPFCSVQQGEFFYSGDQAGDFQMLAKTHPQTVLLTFPLSILEKVGAQHPLKQNIHPHMVQWLTKIHASLSVSPSLPAFSSEWEQVVDFQEKVIARFQEEIQQALLLDTQQLSRRKQQDNAYQRDAYREIERALKPFAQGMEGEEIPHVHLGEPDLLLEACRKVGTVLRQPIFAPDPSSEETSQDFLASVEEHMESIASASKIRFRKILLTGHWWKEDGGPFVGFQQDGTPVALVPRTRGGYNLFAPGKPKPQHLHHEQAQQLMDFGFVLYRAFPKRALNFRDVLSMVFKSVSRVHLLWILLFGSLAGLLNALNPVLVGVTIERIVPEKDAIQLVHIALLILSVGLSAILFNLAKAFLTARVETALDTGTQVALWDHLADLPPSFFRQSTSGEISNRVMGFYQLRMILSSVLSDTVLSALFSVFYLVILFAYSPSMAAWALGLTLINLATTVVLGFFQVKAGYRKIQVSNRLSGEILQLLLGVGKLRVSGAENRAFFRWSHRYAQLKRNTQKEGILINVNKTLNTLFGVLSAMVIFTFSLQSPGLTLGGFVAFNSAFNAFQVILFSLSSMTMSLSFMASILWNIKPVLHTAPETPPGQSDPGTLQGNIECLHVNFRYYPNSPPVLQDLSVHIPAGGYVAVVGPSGSGKSTLLRLLLGFERPESGKVYYDNRDLSQLNLQKVRKQLGVVLQTSGLISGDLFTNIAGTDPSLDLDDVREACRMAGILEDIEKMPMGFFTFVNESASTLSGGQKQRILIARALVKKPRILFFDEATSALDNITQRTVVDTLKSIRATRVVIAHRLSTVKECDSILVLEKGKIVEQGNFEQLMQKKGAFFDLVQRQVL